ncbi:hypothetical protein A1O1_01035 [Capronia coronata CBS 617.96]|uniref:Calcineurin-like phosphoesterase domain-containing protein n=1 Tax=Capronia coronata CBS 617.96 TaxID=1182541 RepID=W9Z1V0_9EURO|nr:uncharacterized protein A1O1_01035 [Capronia coronata CBS 617.96]EXJ95910.1 hypothetical protein A1O1_01035 [Capronia coronata CBS 617.96]
MTTRRVRIVCISDTHNQTPKLPTGDILIHAGDLTNQGTFSELKKTINWLGQTSFKVKVIVCGNHDITCDIPFYQQYGAYFHNKRMEDPQQCIALLQSDSSIVYLNHELKQVRIDHEDGSCSLLKIFGSPYSPARGLWAFGYSPEHALELWHQIPLDSDIVVTHTPAKFHRDECATRGASGCERLRETLWRVRPRLHVCGHVHEAYGVEAVTWDISCPYVKFKEKGIRRWNDPGPEGKKQFTVDLSARAQSTALRNDGSAGNLVSNVQLARSRGVEVDGAVEDGQVPEANGYEGILPAIPPPPRPPFPSFEKAERPIPSTGAITDYKLPATHGLGGPGSHGRSDQEAISGREGRVETCIVNAAYMATNWPHKAGKKFHKPIVIDLDMPVEYPDHASPV